MFRFILNIKLALFILLLLPVSSLSAGLDKNWFPFEIGWEGVSTIQGNSKTFVEAGCQGFVNLGQDGHFFLNGSRTRFFGVQVTPTVTGGEAGILGKRLSSFGFNLWRNGAHLILSNELIDNSRQIRIFDSFFSEMKEKGLYCYFRLGGSGDYVRYAFGNPQICEYFGFEENHVVKGKGGGWNPNHPTILLSYLMEPALVKAERKWWKFLLTHVNPHTKKAYEDEPAILCMELLNECYLLGAWEMGMLGLGVFPSIMRGIFRGFGMNGWLTEVRG